MSWWMMRLGVANTALVAVLALSPLFTTGPIG